MMAKRWEGEMGRREGKETKESYVNPRNGTEYEGRITNLNRLHQSQFAHEHLHLVLSHNAKAREFVLLGFHYSIESWDL
jgi:hypothetical protein